MFRPWLRTLPVLAFAVILLTPVIGSAQQWRYSYPYNYGFTMGRYPYYYSNLYPPVDVNVPYVPPYQAVYYPGLGYSLRYELSGTTTPVYGNYQAFIPSNSSAASNTPQPADTTATLDVHVPDPQAEIWIDGHKTKQTGISRQFVSPDLTPGQTYQYEIRAQWTSGGRKVEQTQKVNIQAGHRIAVDFLPGATTAR